MGGTSDPTKRGLIDDITNSWRACIWVKSKSSSINETYPSVTCSNNRCCFQMAQETPPLPPVPIVLCMTLLCIYFPLQPTTDIYHFLIRVTFGSPTQSRTFNFFALFMGPYKYGYTRVPSFNLLYVFRCSCSPSFGLSACILPVSAIYILLMCCITLFCIASHVLYPSQSPIWFPL